MKKQSNGITLVALVITIIVLLILAGISIASLTGENGVLNKSAQAKDKYEYSTAYEILNLKISEANIEKQKKCTLEELEQFLGRENEIDIVITQYNKVAKKSSTLGEYPTGKLVNIVVYVVQYEKYYFLIGESGTIEKISNDRGDTFTDINDFDPTLSIKNSWKEILDSANIDSSKFNTFEEVLEDKDTLKSLASNETAVKDIINNESLYDKIQNSENSSDFFENINMNNTETLNFVEDENPYYTFEAKANKTYFIQCYGAQGGSFYQKMLGGCGGYSYGIYKPTQDTTLYIYKGGAGAGTIGLGTIAGGYNGGGSVIYTWGDGNELRASGGGATHIALVPRTIIKFRR